MGRALRKLFASFLLTFPAVVMFLENASRPTGKTSPEVPLWVASNVTALEFGISHYAPSWPEKYSLFFLASLGILVCSFFLALHSGWKLRGDGRNSLGAFVRTFLSRYFIGELAVSLYGLFIFVLFAIVLTAWLPDAIEMGNVWFTLGAGFYFLAMVFATAFVYPAPKREKKSDKPAVVKCLVYGLSRPSNWNLIQNATCEDMRRNRRLNLNGQKVSISLFPLYVSMHYQLSRQNPKLGKVFLLVTDSHLVTETVEENGKLVEKIAEPPRMKDAVKRYLRDFFERASTCLGVKFLTMWPSERPELFGKGEKEVVIEFVPIYDANRVKNIFDDIGKSEIATLIKRDSGNVSFHLTGGTAPMSIAMMLHAIKGDTHAEYAKQGVFDVDNPEELLLSVDMDVFDLEDLVRELREYFERSYERK